MAAAGTDRTRIIAMIAYSTAIDELSTALGGVYVPWIGEHRPALACIGVVRLALPQTPREVTGCALVTRGCSGVITPARNGFCLVPKTHNGPQSPRTPPARRPPGVEHSGLQLYANELAPMPGFLLSAHKE